LVWKQTIWQPWLFAMIDGRCFGPPNFSYIQLHSNTFFSAEGLFYSGTLDLRINQNSVVDLATTFFDSKLK
jgi:hypothetical protein